MFWEFGQASGFLFSERKSNTLLPIRNRLFPQNYMRETELRVNNFMGRSLRSGVPG